MGCIHRSGHDLHDCGVVLRWTVGSKLTPPGQLSSDIPDLPTDTGRGLVGGVDGAGRGAWVTAVTKSTPGSPVEEFSVWTSFAQLWSHSRERGFAGCDG